MHLIDELTFRQLPLVIELVPVEKVILDRARCSFVSNPVRLSLVQHEVDGRF